MGRLCQGQERIEDGQCWGGVGRAQDEEALLMKESTQPPACRLLHCSQENPAERASHHPSIAECRDQAPPTSEELKGG